MVLEMMAPPSDGPARLPLVFGPQYVSEDSLCLLIDKTAYGEYRVIKGDEKETLLTVTPWANNLLMTRDPNKALVALLQIETGVDMWKVSATREEGIAHGEKIFNASGSNTEVKVSFKEINSLFDHVGFQIKRQGKTCTIFEEGSSTEIADILSPENGDKFLVGVRPYVDHAFVAALSVVVDFMKFNTEPEVSPPVVGRQPRFESYSDVIGFKYASQGLTKLVFEKTGKSAACEYTVAKEESMEQKLFIVRAFNGLPVLFDEDGKPIAMLWKKKLTAHARWFVSVFSGETEAELKEVFSVCKRHMVQFHTNLSVILETERGKSSRAAADFMVTRSWKCKTCTILTGDSSAVIAKICPMMNADKFLVEVSPGVDCAFVVSLIAVIDAMKGSGMDDVASHAMDFVIKTAATVAAAGVGVLFELI